jgi:molybdate transport system substrate-binding protein
MRARPPVLLVAVLLLCVTACGGTTDAADAEDRTLTVLAAASLTGPFTDLVDAFEAEHDVQVRLAFDSSATLAGQVVQGAPADVLATADNRTMQQVVHSGTTATRPEPFATNTMVLVVPAADPAGIDTFADLDDSDVTYVTCAESAPCGALARQLLHANGISNPPSSLEVDVKAVLSKVVLDEADAGLVYETDAVSAGDNVRTVQIPGYELAVNSYLVAPLRQSDQPELAAAWVDLVLSESGQDILAEAGFGPPEQAP